MKKNISKKIAMIMCLCMSLTTLAGCNRSGDGGSASDEEGSETVTTTLPVIVTEKAFTEVTTAPSETTTVPTEVTFETEEFPPFIITDTETTAPPEEPEDPPTITYPSIYPPQTQPPQTVYVYVTEPPVTTTTPAPKKDPTTKELLEIARQGFAGILYSDDERILEYTNVALYCQLVGGYNLDAKNDKNTATTIDLNDARAQFRERWTKNLTSVTFPKVLGKLTKGELQAYNKKVRSLYSGGDVLDVTTGFLYEAQAAYKIELSYDLMLTAEHIYAETPYVLVVNYDDFWVFDVCYPLLEETSYRTKDYKQQEEAKKVAEERAKAEEEAQKKLEEERAKALEEAQKQSEEAQKKAEERQKKINEYNQKYSERQKARAEWSNRQLEFRQLENEYLDAADKYEAVYNEFMEKLRLGLLDKDDPQYLYYTNYKLDFETQKRKYEQEKTKFEAEQEKYEADEQAWDEYLREFYNEMGWSWSYNSLGYIY